MAGVLKADEGSIVMNGTISPFLELGVGFQPDLSGRENISLYGALLGLSRREIKERYPEIVAFAEIERFMDQKIRNYSSGMVARLAFAVAAQADADIFLLDEVFAVGDIGFRDKCMNVFRRLKAQGKTIILVSHGFEAIRNHSDRVILLNNGKIEAMGSPNVVISQYENLIQSQKNVH